MCRVKFPMSRMREKMQMMACTLRRRARAPAHKRSGERRAHRFSGVQRRNNSSREQLCSYRSLSAPVQPTRCDGRACLNSAGLRPWGRHQAPCTLTITLTHLAKSHGVKSHATLLACSTVSHALHVALVSSMSL
jgi:hypothetical protein